MFGVRRAVIATQPFHLPRALWLCDALGVAPVGLYGELRELPAAGRAVLDVLIRRARPSRDRSSTRWTS